MFLPTGCGFPCLLKLPESLKLHGASMARDWHCFSSMMKLNCKRNLQGLCDLTRSSVGRSWAGDIGYMGNSVPYSNSSCSRQPWTCHFSSLCLFSSFTLQPRWWHVACCLTLSCLTSWNRNSLRSKLLAAAWRSTARHGVATGAALRGSSSSRRVCGTPVSPGEHTQQGSLSLPGCRQKDSRQ